MLSVYRVLDLCNEVGIFCGKIFADLGADVIKIEKPGGDPTRNTGPFYHDIPHPEKSLSWFAYNTSKKSITLNIETRQGQEIFKELVKKADLVLESFPPGYMSSLGLGYKELSKLNPSIIMTSITPFGQTGPYQNFKPSDLVLLAMGGLLTLAGDPDRAPVRFSVEQSYPQAGAQAAAASMIALHYCQLSGEGQQVDISVQESITQALIVMGAQWWDLVKEIPHREGTRVQRAQLKSQLIYPCKDGYISWRIYTAALGRGTNAIVTMMRERGEVSPEVEGIDFTKIDMNYVDAETYGKWEEAFGRFFAKLTKAELHREAVNRDIMIFPVNSIQDVLSEKQLQARQFWVNVEHPELDATITYPGAPFKSTLTPWRISRRAPLIGEHNEEVYGELLGMSQEELWILKEQGAI